MTVDNGEVLAEIPIGEDRKLILMAFATEFGELLRIGMYQVPLDEVDEPYSGVVFPLNTVTLTELILVLQGIKSKRTKRTRPEARR